MTILDDLDQSVDATTRTFSIGIRVYQIDLTDANFEKLEKAVLRFVKAARDITPVSRRPNHDPYDGIDQGVVREWAKSQDLEVNEKGRVPLDLVYAYKRALEADTVDTDAVETPDDGPSELHAV
ncbi:histone-like nucleoid-structuring protein Lsr2 [Nakamurella sp. PAMC28650]|uniref:Lsr2 dimerization domain-containing protein n=1 Tax=Nakamurella sp. PAMC28650 TaxID=2762325 RepID=UPI00164D3DC0|nr:histone-like nucleoid-structuring protein Lsr2 [Nakamurella sp. PAMC28650]QNK82573.1 Lsr2 family protein [Nakamurella sp. PAMC28650]